MAWTQRIRDEGGAVVVIMAIVLVAITGIASLAIDGGILQTDKRDDQNAADHAALAAAWAHCNGSTAQVAGLASAARNGFNNDGTSNMVTITDLGTDSAGRRRWEAEIRSERGTAFASTVGASRLRAVAYAIAGCVPGGGGGGYALFAIGNCPETIDWSGSNVTINGDIHSNNQIDSTGNRNTVNGNTTYEDSFGPQPQDSSNDFNPPQIDDPAPDNPDPLSSVFQIAHFQPGGSKALAAGARFYNFTGNDINSGSLAQRGLLDQNTGRLSDGLYYTDRLIDLSHSNLNGDVTFVSSSDRVLLQGSSMSLTPFDPDDLLLYSPVDRNCGESGVYISGSNSINAHVNGILYAPRSMVELSGSNSTYNGSIVGEEVRISGSNIFINYVGTGGGGQPRVELLE